MATSCGPGTFFVPAICREYRLLSSHFWITLFILMIPLLGVNTEKNKNCKLNLWIHFFPD